MLEWPRYSVYGTQKYIDLRRRIKNPGPGRPKTWAYPWCILNSELKEDLFSLDFGCGSWTNFTYFINRITKSMTIGVDTGHLQKDAGQVRFVQNMEDRIEFPANFFDRVFSISVLEHVPLDKRKSVLKELFRVLRPGGLAVLTIDWVFDENERLMSQLRKSLHLRRQNSQIYGNFDFSSILSENSDVVEPLRPIDETYLPGSSSFDEKCILADDDILVTQSDKVTDVELFKYTTVGLILRKLPV